MKGRSLDNLETRIHITENKLMQVVSSVADCLFSHRTHPSPLHDNEASARPKAVQLKTAPSDSLAARCGYVTKSGQVVLSGCDKSNCCILQVGVGVFHYPSHFLWAGKWVWCWRISLNRPRMMTLVRNGAVTGQKGPGPWRALRNTTAHSP